MGDPAFAAAFEKAVRASAPYPADTPRMFSIGYRAMVTSTPARAANAGDAERQPFRRPAPSWPGATASAPASAPAESGDTMLRDPSQLRLRPAAPDDER